MRPSKLSETHFEEVKVLEISNAYSVTADFGGVRGTDTLFGGANLITAELVFVDTVYHLVKIKDDVCTIGDEDAVFSIDTRLGESIYFFDEGWEVDDDSIADDADGLFVKDSGGEKVKFVLFAFDYNGVASVGSSRDAGTDIIFLCRWARDVSL